MTTDRDGRPPESRSTAPQVRGAPVLTRESLADGSLRRAMLAIDPTAKYLTDEERGASLAAMFPTGVPEEGVWLFGYGSLIWNPAFEFVEQRIGVIKGWHRRYCLWSSIGRGTPDCPGLMLGLERGGSCRGVVFRIANDVALGELDLVWRREMMSGAYVARWVDVATTAGRRVRSIAFTINPQHERYVGAMDEEKAAAIIAEACGQLGSCADYLYNTLDHLHELGIHDRMMERIGELVGERLRLKAETAL